MEHKNDYAKAECSPDHFLPAGRRFGCGRAGLIFLSVPIVPRIHSITLAIMQIAKPDPDSQEPDLTGRAQARKRTFMSAFQILSAVLLIATIAAPVGAQSYPARPIRLILPFPPGGATDILGRIVGQKLSERLGQPVVADNRPGAGGYLGLDLAAKALPDGYTIVLGSLVLASGPSLYKKIQFNPLRDLAPISQISQSPNLVLVHPSLPVKTLKELVEYVRAQPGKLNYGSSGVGSPLHLSAELLKTVAKINIVHVPYKGLAVPQRC